MATRVQSAANASPADPAVATISAATAGNLLVVAASERSGTTAANFTITDNVGTATWTKRVSHDVELGNATFRRSLAVWTAVAAGGETTITVDNGTTNGKRILAQEFEHEDGEDEWSFQVEESADNGTTADAVTQSTGTTAAPSGTKFLSLGLLYVKVGANAPGASQMVTWTNGLDDSAIATSSNNGQTLACSYDGDATSTAGYESEATYAASSDTSNSGLLAAMLVISLVSGGVTGWGPLLADGRNRLVR